MSSGGFAFRVDIRMRIRMRIFTPIQEYVVPTYSRYLIVKYDITSRGYPHP